MKKSLKCFLFVFDVIVVLCLLQPRGLMSFSKYSPYYPLFGVRLDEQPSAFRAHKPTEKSAFEPPAAGHTACQLYYNGKLFLINLDNLYSSFQVNYPK